MKRKVTPKSVLSRVLSFYYGHPEKDLRLIVISSDEPSALGSLIDTIIANSGEKSALVRS